MAICSVCGRTMTAHKDERGIAYPIQLCGEECTKTGWNIVTFALKRGVRPKWYEEKTGKKFRLTEEERDDILELAGRGYSAQDIAAMVGRSYATVRNLLRNIIGNYGLER